MVFRAEINCSVAHGDKKSEEADLCGFAARPSMESPSLLGIPHDIATNVCNVINSQGYAVAHMTYSWDGEGFMDVHVTHTEATKEHAIKAWQKIESVTKAETIGMGDSGNDIPLF